MIFLSRVRSSAARLTPRRWYSVTTSTNSSRKSDPLRILFCGSDHFSCASLEALHQEHKENAGLIESLDVMVLPPKRTGRGLKELREVPCSSLAERLGLRTHQVGTFTGWTPPEGINLIVAVSFGLFVPPRILQGAKYGGLNVHPSLLPDLRGPAPIHHAFLKVQRYTGVSLQTLDEHKFDHGTVLSQTPSPGFEIPRNFTFDQLYAELAQQGAKMLVQGLRDGVHVPPHENRGWKSANDKIAHAPKVSKENAECDFWNFNHSRNPFLPRKEDVFGSMWMRAADQEGNPRRVKIRDVEWIAKRDDERILRPTREASEMDVLKIDFTNTRGYKESCVREVRGGNEGSAFIRVPKGRWIRIGKATLDGEGEKDAKAVFGRLCNTVPADFHVWSLSEETKLREGEEMREGKMRREEKFRRRYKGRRE